MTDYKVNFKELKSRVEWMMSHTHWATGWTGKPV